ncbi:MAG: hypothetical protein O7149_03270, partial [Wolbachia endosymbiont of Hylaeus sinuatus]|nr:hypothetical protein [Wolbachia endosymbiont of Hylaeus sinuatus]
MSNYGIKESGEDYESIGRIVEDEYRIIDDIEVKIKPKSFESNKEKNASVGYVHKVLDKLITELNETFVPNLDDVLHSNKESLGALNVNLETEKGKLGNLIEEV